MARLQNFHKVQSEKLSRYFLLAVFIGTAFIFLNMVKVFLVPVLLAAVFTTLFYPLYEGLLKLFRYRRGVSAFVCCVILLLGLLVPIYFIADLVSREAVQFYQTVEQKIREIVEKGDQGLLGTVKNSKWVQQLDLDKIDWQSTLQEVIRAAGSRLADVINKTSKGTFQMVANLFITLFTMFYFFIDGKALIRRLRYLSPLQDAYEDAIISRFIAISRATVKGTLLIGLTQGGLGALTLWIFGMGSPVLWGVVMAILAMIPMVGAWLVMHPAALIQIIMGNVWQGVAISLITILIISNIDNVMRPRLVGQSAGMHDLMIFFSTLGGISMFGAMGFIVGPVIAALFLAILDIYSLEFKPQLDLAQDNTSSCEEARAPVPVENPPQKSQTK